MDAGLRLNYVPNTSELVVCCTVMADGVTPVWPRAAVDDGSQKATPAHRLPHVAAILNAPHQAVLRPATTTAKPVPTAAAPEHALAVRRKPPLAARVRRLRVRGTSPRPPNTPSRRRFSMTRRCRSSRSSSRCTWTRSCPRLGRHIPSPTRRMGHSSSPRRFWVF